MPADIAIDKAFSENAGDVAIPFMVLGELYCGAARSKDPAHGKSLVDRFAKALPVVESSPATMERFGAEKARLVAAGTPVEDADVEIYNQLDIDTVPDSEKQRIIGRTTYVTSFSAECYEPLLQVYDKVYKNMGFGSGIFSWCRRQQQKK